MLCTLCFSPDSQWGTEAADRQATGGGESRVGSTGSCGSIVRRVTLLIVFLRVSASDGRGEECFETNLCFEVYLYLCVEFLAHVCIQVDIPGVVYNWIVFTAVLRCFVVTSTGAHTSLDCVVQAMKTQHLSVQCTRSSRC